MNEDFFTLDTKAVQNNSESEVEEDDDDDDDDDGDEFDINPLRIKIRKEEVSVKEDKDDINLEKFERDMGWTGKKRRKQNLADSVTDIIENSAPLKEILKKSVVRDGFERLRRVPQYNASEKKLKVIRKRQREKTKGSQWYNLPATEITDEVRHDLEILQMRSALDPKHFYKKNDMKVLPKYFHIGKVLDNPLDFYGDRMTKKERKRTIVDELMADAEYAKFSKRKYEEIIKSKDWRKKKRESRHQNKSKT
ncbi:deoxynucleotidyltransferase terminal-interacting protein 2 [Copidosoma floridanum]|uniref:deoxynucleotidyltransferase terminal-interacting protein 2 n=1 Tax=Copidosoma floridanum TaxID=29053 RepID=UPI0006C95C7F|nr:deoxynucleotidyltransferase terminal-interacting protein 2 [Copidosoma floridanum]